MKTPCCSAASITSWPLRASISRPLIVRLTASSDGSGTGHLPRGFGVGRARHLHRDLDRTTDVRLELVAEPGHGRCDRRHGGRAERTDRRLPRWPVDAGADVVADV